MSSIEIIISIFSSFLVLINVNRIRLRIDNILSLSYYILVIFLFFGSFVSLSGDWWLRSVTHENIHKAFILFHISFIWFSIIVLLYTSIRDTFKISKINIKFNLGIDRIVFPTLLIIIAIIVIFILLPESALISYIKRIRGAEELARLRSLQGVNFNGPKIILYFKNLIIGPILLYLVAFYGISSYLNGGYTKRFWLVIILTAVTLIIDLSKAPIIVLILLIFLLRFRYLTSRIRIRRYFLLGSVILLFVYSIAFNITVWESVPRIIHRLTVSQYVGLPIALEVFPENHDFLGVNTISGSVSKLFGMEYIQYSRILMEFANPRGIEIGTAGYLSTYYLAEAYSIKGLWMFILASLITPLYLVLLDLLFRKSNDIFFQSFYMILLIKLPFILIDGFTRIFFNIELATLFLIVLTIRYINHLAINKQYD